MTMYYVFIDVTIKLQMTYIFRYGPSFGYNSLPMLHDIAFVNLTNINQTFVPENETTKLTENNIYCMQDFEKKSCQLLLTFYF